MTFFFQLGSVPSTNKMEARNFVTVREMQDQGNYIIPSMNGNIRLEKPPLPTWLSCLSNSFSSDQSDLFYLRFPAALAACLLLIYFGMFSSLYFSNTEIGYYSLMVLSSNIILVKLGRIGSWDIYAHAFMMACIYYLYKTIVKEKHISTILMAGVFFGLSLMSKGPVAVYSLFLPFIISMFIFKREKLLQNKWRLFFIILIGLLVLSWWPLCVYLENSKAFIDVMTKETKARFNQHYRPFWFYMHFIVFLGPWAIAGFFAVLAYMKSTYKNNAIQNLVFWILLCLVLLSIIPEKKERYLLPLMIPLTMFVVYYCKEFMDSRNVRDYGKISILMSIHKWTYIVLILISPISVLALIGFDHIWWGIILGPVSLLLIYYLYRSVSGNDTNLLFSRVVYTCIFYLCVLWILLPETSYSKRKFEKIASIRPMAYNINAYAVEDIDIRYIWEFGKSIQKYYEGKERKIVLFSHKPLSAYGVRFDGFDVLEQKVIPRNKNDHLKVWICSQLQKKI